jgi:flagellar assembly factor FliW
VGHKNSLEILKEMKAQLKAPIWAFSCLHQFKSIQFEKATSIPTLHHSF